MLAGLVAGCAVRLGGGGPVTVRTVGLYVDVGMTGQGLGGWLLDAGADVALVAAPTDTAWFRTAGDSAALDVSGPGRVGDLYLGFLAMEPLGDTTISLDYEGGTLRLHDALYQVGDERLLDLLAFPITDGARARPMVRSLLRYVATDVGPTAAVVIGVAAENEAAADSVGSMLSPAFTDVRRCMEPDARAAARTDGRHLRLFYGPEARVACSIARLLDGPRKPALAELVLLR